MRVKQISVLKHEHRWTGVGLALLLGSNFTSDPHARSTTYTDVKLFIPELEDWDPS